MAESSAGYNHWEMNQYKWPEFFQKWDYDFFTKLSSIVIYVKGNIQGYFLKEDLANTTLTHRRLSAYMVKNTGPSIYDEFYLLVGTRIFEGLLTPRIHHGLMRVDSNKADLSEPLTRVSS